MIVPPPPVVAPAHVPVHLAPAAVGHRLRPTLRPYQSKLKNDVYSSWAAGARVVMAVAPTGAGKTVLFSDILEEHTGAACAIAHRQELVSQISLALARNGVRHRIIGQDKTIKACRKKHLRELGRHFIDPNSRVAVAGIDTLVNIKPTDPEYAWVLQVTLWVGDEGHHFLKANKWGRGVAMFTNPTVRGLLVTATPIRADGKGLGSANDGLADVMVLAPTMRELINMGYLTDYRVFAPPSKLDLSNVPVGESGEFVAAALSKATHDADMVGDVVDQYLKIAPGLLGITFAVDVQEATDIAARFREKGVRAEVVHAKTPDDLRADILARFERREVMQLVNVDLFGEGFDLPAIEVVSMARATNSFSLYAQQWGRALRLMLDPTVLKGWDQYDDATRRYFISISSKPRAVIIDHVGNVVRHNGPPDRRQIPWSLDRRDKRATSASEAIPYRNCNNPHKLNPAPGQAENVFAALLARTAPEDLVAAGMATFAGVVCVSPYPRVHRQCPYCGHYPEPAARSAPSFVDGDLLELDEAALTLLWGDIGKIWAGPPATGSSIVAMSIKKNHYARQDAQRELVEAMQWYGGYLRDVLGVADTSEAWRRFYFKFGIDVASAQTLGAPDANALREKIVAELEKAGVRILATT
jgi:superfamily II DNA or RNA helicase